MKIDISDQTKRRFELDRKLGVEDLPVYGELLGRVRPDGLTIAGTLRRLPEQKYELVFHLGGTLIYPCSRCLDPVETQAEYDFEDIVESGAETEFDLLPFIEDCLFINEPSKILCREDCRGLCQHCGANLNYETCSCDAEAEIDPRMEALKSLL